MKVRGEYVTSKKDNTMVMLAREPQLAPARPTLLQKNPENLYEGAVLLVDSKEMYSELEDGARKTNQDSLCLCHGDNV